MSSEKTYTPPLNQQQIMELLPHRYPFLLVDRVLEIEGDKRIVGIKNVTANEPHFTGHFPGNPIMPGVLLLEAMAQLGAILVLLKPEFKGRLVYLTGIDNAKIRRPVVPGDTLRMEVEVTAMRSVMGKTKAIATVDGQTAAEAEISFAISR
ncbi:MAG: 3-hydroxyacyl-ACP dehydratase FabZ [bacterium]